MLKILNLIIIIVIPIIALANFEYIDSILITDDYLSYQSYIKDKELKIVLKGYVLTKSFENGNTDLIKKMIIEYDKSMEDIILKQSKNIKDMSIIVYLKKKGYKIVNQDYFMITNDYKMLLTNFINKRTDSFILKNINSIDSVLLYDYLINSLDIDFIDTINKIKNIKNIKILKNIVNKDTVNIKFSSDFFNVLFRIKDKRLIEFYSKFIPDSINNKRLCYFKGRYYEKIGEFINAKNMFYKADDEEAYIRMIAKAGEKYSRSFSDSLLLNDTVNYKSVLYHKAKVLLYKGKLKQAEKILLELSNNNSVDYYSMRARYLINYKIKPLKKMKPENIEFYSNIYKIFQKHKKEELFDKFILLKYKQSKNRALFYALIYDYIKRYNMEIFYGHKMLYNNYLFEDALQFIFPIPYYNEFKFASDSADIDIALLYAIAREESWFNKDAISSAGAMGIMQLMNFVYNEYAEDRDYFNIKKNILIGALHIKRYLDFFPENSAYGIMAYNAGPFNVIKWERKYIDWELYLEMIPFRETRMFVKRILRSYYYYRSILSES